MRQSAPRHGHPPTRPVVSALFKKLNLGSHEAIHVLHAPASFEPALDALDNVSVARTISSTARFVLAFVITQRELDDVSAAVARHCAGDAIVWMVYPKRSSRRYRCEFNRDSGWTALGSAGFEPVRMVAIDDDWSALRFRRVEFIKAMTRNPANAISKAGRAKSTDGTS